MRKKIVYLAGGMHSNWRSDLRITIRRHMRTVGVPASQVVFIDPTDWAGGNEKDYTERDLAAIRMCDVVLGVMTVDNPSGYGLSVEVGYAYALGKPIIWCQNPTLRERNGWFGMHRVMSDKVVHSYEEAAKALFPA